MAEPMYLLMKRGLYWRPNGAGYTGLKREAGRYTAEDSSWVDNERVARHEPKTTRVLESKAERFAPACASDVRERELAACLDAAVALVRECIKAERARRAKLKTGSVAAGYCDGRLERLEAALAEAER